MQKYKYNIRFRLEKRAGITENVPIIADITFSGKRLFFPVGYRTDFSKWVETKVNGETISLAKKNTFNAKGDSASEINERIYKIRDAIKEVFRKLEYEKITPTPSSVRDGLKKYLSEEATENKTFFEYYQQFIDEISILDGWSNSTIKKHKTAMNQFKDFQKNLYLDDVTEEVLTRFVKHLLKKQKIVQHKSIDSVIYTNNNNYILKCLKIFKWFMNWATKRKYNTNLDFRNFNPKLKGVNSKQNIIALTVEEFLHLYSMEIKAEYLIKVRDVFCFCCATSLRYSDVKNLKWSFVKDDYIDLTTVKTNDSLRIPLNDYSRNILDKYRTISRIDDLCLPVISNQKYNDYLKELCKQAGFDSTETIIHYHGSERIERTFEKWELITSHTARKTFVTFGLLLEIPSEVIRAFTGHKDPKVMERYYHLGMKEKSRFMDKFKVIKNTMEPEIGSNIETAAN